MSARESEQKSETTGAATREKTRYEPWAWLAFGVGLCTGVQLLFLGWKPGGELPVTLYRWGPLVLGGAAAIGLFLALLWCWRRRPALQRGRIVPLSVLAASLWLCSLPIAYPSSHEGKVSPIRFRLPFEGTARVRYGGEEHATNRLLFDPPRRFGLCFEPHGDGPLAVVAPAAGRVLEVSDGRVGKVLVLALDGQEFCVLEGLDPDSLTLAAGDDASPGEALGRASGLLVVYLQDGPELERREGIPMRFWNYVADGRTAASGMPVPPQEVAAAPAVPPPAAVPLPPGEVPARE